MRRPRPQSHLSAHSWETLGKLLDLCAVGFIVSVLTWQSWGRTALTWLHWGPMDMEELCHWYGVEHLDGAGRPIGQHCRGILLIGQPAQEWEGEVETGSVSRSGWVAWIFSLFLQTLFGWPHSGMATILNPLPANSHLGQLLQKQHFLTVRSGSLRAASNRKWPEQAETTRPG